MPSDNLCFVISPFGGYNDIYYQEVFRPAIESVGLVPVRGDDVFAPGNIVEQIWGLIVSCKAVLADATGRNPNVFYELGLAHAAQKPVLLLSADVDDIPFDLRALRHLTFDMQHPLWAQNLQTDIAQGLNAILASPESSVLKAFRLTDQEAVREAAEERRASRPASGVQTIFLSYARPDQDYVERLRVHLKPLERTGSVRIWSDDALTVGSDWEASIRDALDEASVVVVLVSPDYLASDFVYTQELPSILERGESGGAVVFPIMVRPAMWRNSGLETFQFLNDPNKPLALLDKAGQEHVLSRAAEAISALLSERGDKG